MSKIFKVRVKDREYEVEVEELRKSSKKKTAIEVKPEEKPEPKQKTEKKEEIPQVVIPKISRPKVEAKVGEQSDDVIAPLPGVVVDILVKKGRKVKEGDKVVILEAMKMENALLAPISGKVENIHVKKGQEVGGNYPLITIVG